MTTDKQNFTQGHNNQKTKLHPNPDNLQTSIKQNEQRSTSKMPRFYFSPPKPIPHKMQRRKTILPKALLMLELCKTEAERAMLYFDTVEKLEAAFTNLPWHVQNWANRFGEWLTSHSIRIPAFLDHERLGSEP